MADDPIVGFGARITKRARRPCVGIMAIPLLCVAFQYFLFLLDGGFGLNVAIAQIKKDWGLIAFVAGLPAIVFALFRELQIHKALDKVVGLRRKVDHHIANLMANLARDAGYDHPDRVSSNVSEALNWFYIYANQPSALRTYAFEIWEGYYVNLYASLASILAFLLCLFLALYLPLNAVIPFAILSFLSFLAFWIVRRSFTIPRIMRVPAQQIQEIRPTSDVLSEANRRFGT